MSTEVHTWQCRKTTFNEVCLLFPVWNVLHIFHKRSKVFSSGCGSSQLSSGWARSCWFSLPFDSILTDSVRARLLFNRSVKQYCSVRPERRAALCAQMRCRINVPLVVVWLPLSLGHLKIWVMESWGCHWNSCRHFSAFNYSQLIDFKK